MSSPTPCLDNPLRVAPELVPVLEEMLASASPAYRDAAELACEALKRGELLGIQTSSRRFLVLLRDLRARPAPAPAGALFQCLARRLPPENDADLPGWIIAEDHYRGGKLIMAHELAHFANRLALWNQRSEPPNISVHGWDPTIVATVRARFLDEVAARHTAFLAESSLDADTNPSWPAPGALFACAVKIATYPEVFGDPGVTQTVIKDGGRPALRSLLGGWFSGLRGLRFYRPGTSRATRHAEWLETELACAALGNDAPDVEPEGTL